MPNRTAKTRVLAGGATNDYDLTANNEALRRSKSAEADIGRSPLPIAAPAKMVLRPNLFDAVIQLKDSSP